MDQALMAEGFSEAMVHLMPFGIVGAFVFVLVLIVLTFLP